MTFRLGLFKRLSLIVLVLSFATACDTYHYVAGTWKEDSRKPVEALKDYEAFLSHRPRDPRSCEVRLRAAALYRGFGRCAEARAHWEAAARDFPSMPACADRAKASLLSCPDYFPLDLGRTWTYVDSDSKGRAMRLDWEVRRATAAAGGIVETSLYAGSRRIRDAREAYEKRDWAVWRADAAPPEPLLRYPFTEGKTWRGERAGDAVEWKIVSTGADVKVAAGEFKGCLKVREHVLKFAKTWRFDYYCPDVGRTKITIAGPGFENPNTELLKYDKL